MATGNETKVDTKLFASTADAVGNISKEMDRLCQDWNKSIGGLRKGGFEGDSSVNIKNTVDQVQKSAADLVKALSGYQSALREIAGIYDKTEKNIQETSKTLKFDKAFR